ncbi:hypothetical protein GDO86_011418 [Hymenochirus boettgeri]|uniref:Uncharacterized protein n=1 Tax=Hymenochirus boettgeri TaxID=247094 RepID=A0A8T2JE85_9PIPI|nr:hypothetical protein GDO86_011418 [Hymenochirus boettgeri]
MCKQLYVHRFNFFCFCLFFWFKKEFRNQTSKFKWEKQFSVPCTFSTEIQDQIIKVAQSTSKEANTKSSWFVRRQSTGSANTKWESLFAKGMLAQKSPISITWASKSTPLFGTSNTNSALKKIKEETSQDDLTLSTYSQSSSNQTSSSKPLFAGSTCTKSLFTCTNSVDYYNDLQKGKAYFEDVKEDQGNSHCQNKLNEDSDTETPQQGSSSTGGTFHPDIAQTENVKPLTPELLKFFKGKDVNIIIEILKTISPFYPALQKKDLAEFAKDLSETGELK